jgi:hypothetical protein
MSRPFLGSYRQQPSEILDYYVDYSQWLKSGETITDTTLTVSPVTSPPLAVSDVFTDDNVVLGFTVSGGVSGTSYQVTVLSDSSDELRVEREITFTVEEF